MQGRSGGSPFCNYDLSFHGRGTAPPPTTGEDQVFLHFFNIK